jgi:hypothetical protein
MIAHPDQVFARVSPWLGWLVMSGSAPYSSPLEDELSARILAHCDLTLPCLWLDIDGEPLPGMEITIEEIEPEFAAPIERIGVEDDLPGEDLEASLILMAGRDAERWVETVVETPLGTWLLGQLDAGGVVFAAGAAAAALGSWVFPAGAGTPGCKGAAWLPGAVLLPGIIEPAIHTEVRAYLAQTEHSYALGLPEGSTLSFGPEGQVEVWGSSAPKVVLGRGWLT